MSDPEALSPVHGPAARRERVRRHVLAQGFARVEDLAQALAVSVMTVHRDLDLLEAEGWLVKIRGGATANPAALVDAGVPERSQAMRQEKAAIAAVAARMLTHSQTVFLDDSTTALALVPYVQQLPQMTVATNFLPGVRALSETPGVAVHVLGGELHRRQESMQGLATAQAISRLHADLLFMSTTALSHGVCLHRSEATVAVRHALMRHADHTVLMVDHAKLGRPAPHVLCSVADFDTVVVDSNADPEDLDELRSLCADVQVADVDGAGVEVG